MLPPQDLEIAEIPTLKQVIEHFEFPKNHEDHRESPAMRRKEAKKRRPSLEIVLDALKIFHPCSTLA